MAVMKPAASTAATEDWAEVRRVASAHKSFIHAFLSLWLVRVVMYVSNASPSTSLVVSILLSLWLGAASLRLAVMLYSPRPWLWALVMLVPLLNLFGMLAQSRLAIRYFRTRGVRVGFLGPSKRRIAEAHAASRSRDEANA